MIHKILFSQPRPENAHNPYSRLEEQFGVQCDFHQFIHIEGLTASEFRQQRINPLDYSAVILNSRLSAEQYFRMCTEMRLKVPDSMHYYCNSEHVGLYLQKYIQYRKRKVFFPETGNKFEDLLPAMHRRPNERYLMVLSDIHTDDQINMFAQNRIEVKPAIMYRTVTTPWPEDKPFDYDIVALFTPAGVKALKENKDITIIITPEGTRKPVRRFKRGFYEIASQAGVPIAVTYINYKTRHMGIGPLIEPSGDFDADMRYILDFYTDVAPRNAHGWNIKALKETYQKNNL
jgi:uroporphyrinogen-III synthase